MAFRLRRPVSASLRYKLLLLVLFPILVVMPVALWVAISWADQFTSAQLLRKVNTDLAVAHNQFARIQRDHLAELQSLADSYTFRTAFSHADRSVIGQELEGLRQKAGFDFLHLTDRRGRWLFVRDDPGGPQASKPSLQREKVLATGHPSAGVEVFNHQDLERESPLLAQKASMWLVHTPDAALPEEKTETRGLVLRMIYPVKVAGRGVVALLDGGVLLNRNFRFVDAIRELVYGPDSMPSGGRGAVTVFLGGVRVSTNVPHQQSKGERALGTGVSKAILTRVLGKGQKWVGRSFVVNDWYISAYRPIVDVNGRRVGMLNTEVLEAPFRTPYYRALVGLVAMLLLAALLGAVLAIRGAKSIFRPIELMTAVVRAEQAGEKRRIGPLPARDEIGELARQFDAMLDLLQARNEQIRAAAGQLEIKVQERTAQLQEKNRRLERTVELLRHTRRQLVTAEKLAALGELTAGVAHEINNPTAVILGNMDLIVAELGDRAEPVRTEIELIIEQVYRIRSILDQLLRYSRSRPDEGGFEPVDVNAVVENTLALVNHELRTKQLEVNARLEAVTRVQIRPQELQQVLVNLLVNAAHASRPRGRIDVTTREWAAQGVVLSVQDYGCGIPASRLDKVFDPFFTTTAKGTGLGLSVSYGLIRHYGGQITVASEEGAWTRFEVFVRRQPVYTDDEEALMERYAGTP